MIVHDVCKAIVDVLSTKYIKIPTGNHAMDIVCGFEATWGFPQCFGAIDGSRIPIIIDYYNRKRFHSIVLQGLADHHSLHSSQYL